LGACEDNIGSLEAIFFVRFCGAIYSNCTYFPSYLLPLLGDERRDVVLHQGFLSP
jgi:hypothetical protein